MADRVETADALAVAREAAAEAIVVLRGAASGAGGRNAVEKTPRDFVTEIDHAVEARIVERIARAFPDHSVVAEESGYQTGSSAFRWIIDPLDGTTNFVHRFPMFAVSIALFEGDSPRVGLVVDPVRGEWFTARSGHGSRLDSGDPEEGVDLSVANDVEPSHRLLATGFPFRHPSQIDTYLEAFRALFAQIGDMRRAGSAALDMAYVAAGRVDGFWELGLNLWDIAAGELLIVEAGGRVSDWTGGTAHRQTGWIAAGTPSVHAILVETLACHAPDAGAKLEPSQ